MDPSACAAWVLPVPSGPPIWKSWEVPFPAEGCQAGDCMDLEDSVIELSVGGGGGTAPDRQGTTDPSAGGVLESGGIFQQLMEVASAEE